MAQSHDYLKKGDEDLARFATNLAAYASNNHQRWKVPPPIDFLNGPLAAYLAALSDFLKPNHGKIDTENKNKAKDILTKALRTYIQGYIARNPLVTDEDKNNMRIPLRDTTPTTHPVPEDRPDTEAVPEGTGTHTVTAINPNTHNKRKPDNVTGVAFARRLRKQGESVSRAGDMPSDFQAGTSRAYHYTEAEYGMIADYATAYENGSGKRGPWSNVTSLIISG
jgi:hypothetical protein